MSRSTEIWLGLLRSSRWLLVSGLLVARAAVAVTDLEPVGLVIVATGKVLALSASGETRRLQRRSPFYSGDIIRTDTASGVQLRFSDGALTSLRADSEFKVDEYRFENQGGAGDRSMTTLIKGGLRTLTGAIGKQDPDAYRLSTPVATIGVRGTHYEAVLESSKSLVLAAWQGGIRVQNKSGVLDLGMGASYNFARANAEQSPQGLLEPPTALQNETPIGQTQSTGQQSDTATAEDADGQSAGSAEENSDTDPSDSASATTETAAAATEDSASASFGMQDGSIAVFGDTACSTCTPPQQIAVNEAAGLQASSDLRFSASEWNNLQTTPYLGIAVEANSTADFGFEGGHVLYHDTPSPVFINKELGPHEAGYATAPIMDVLRRGDASVDAFASHTVDAGHTFYWGTWNGTVNPAEIQIDPTDGAITELVYNPFHWATMLPTDLAAMAARTGSVNYNSVVVAHGGGSGGGPLTAANVSFAANVNFDTGAITGGMLNVYNGPETWNVNFAGQVRDSIFDVMIDNSTSSLSVSPSPTQPIEGDIGMAFTGATGQAIGGGFSLQAVGDPSRHVEGVLLVQ